LDNNKDKDKDKDFSEIWDLDNNNLAKSRVCSIGLLVDRQPMPNVKRIDSNRRWRNNKPAPKSAKSRRNNANKAVEIQDSFPPFSAVVIREPCELEEPVALDTGQLLMI
jgi:hypothetical protein